MTGGLGPHDVVGVGEVVGTLVVVCLVLSSMAWMAYRTRWKPR